MRLTNKAREQLRRVLRHVERGRDYVMADHIAVCRHESHATTAMYYTRADGKVLYEVQRAYGSDLCALDTAILDLTEFLTTH